MNVLELKAIQKQYEGELLLNGIDFSLSASEIVCLLGASGSGKSTLLRIIAGLEMPDSGQVYWQGEDITKMPTHLRGFGLMFQDYALFPHMNVADNIAFGLRSQRTRNVDIGKRVDEMLDLVSMAGFARRRVVDLSGGEQQRVALARALAPRPKLLMLDEPLAATDRALSESLSKELKQVLERADIPVLYVTHDQLEAFAVADRIALLHGGNIVQSDSPQKIYTNPATLWAADFFGFSNRMNGTVIRTEPLQIKTDLGIIKLMRRPCSAKPNKKVMLVIPTAAVRIVANQPNSIEAKVTACTFQGQTFRIEVFCKNDIMLTFEHASTLRVGEVISIQLDEEKILCYAEDND